MCNVLVNFQESVVLGPQPLIPLEWTDTSNTRKDVQCAELPPMGLLGRLKLKMHGNHNASRTLAASKCVVLEQNWD